MAPVAKLHFFAAGDLNGDPILELDTDAEYFEGLEFEVGLGLGFIKVVFNRSWPAGLLTSDAFKPETLIRIIVPEIDATKYIAGGFLLTKDLQVIDKQEQGKESLTFGGPGPKYALSRAVLFPEDNGTQTNWNLDTENWVWRWGENAKAGSILNRIINEDAANPLSALDGFLTKSFSASLDSNGDAWVDDIAGEDLFELPIGQNFLDNLYALEDAAESLFTFMDLGEEGTPLMQLDAYQSFGRDLTGVIGAATVHPTEGVNINNELHVDGDAKRRASHAVVHGANDDDGSANWAIAERPSWDAGEYVRHVGIDYERSRQEAVLERAGIRYLRRKENREREITLQLQPGFSPATGLYMPGPDGTNGHVWPGDTISLSTGMGSPSVLDYTADDQTVTAINMKLRKAASGASAAAAALSWDFTLILNKEREGGSAPGSSSQASPQEGKSCNCRSHGGGGGTEFPPECEPDTPSSETVLSDSDNDPSDWPGSSVTTGACWGGDDHMLMNGAGGSSAQQSVSAGTTVGAHVWLRDESGDDPWENVDNYSYVAYIELEGSGKPLIQSEFMHIRYHDVGCMAEVEHFGSILVPTGYTTARVKFRYRLGGWQYRASLTTVTAGTPADNDEFCLDDPGESPYPPHSDDPRFDADDQHLTTKLRERVINSSGGALSRGQVVIPDQSFDGMGVTTTTDAAQDDTPMGIVLVGGADDELIDVMWQGIFRDVIDLDGATAADGDYLFASATAGAADVDNIRAGGAVGQVIRDNGGDTSYVHWWGVPDVDTTSGGTSGAINRVVKTADETVNNSAALQADNHLTLAVAANKRYGWRANLWFSSGTTPDIQWEFIVPSGATGQYSGMGLGTAGADNEGPTYAYGAGVGGPDDQGQGVGVKRHRRFEGFLKTSSTAGNLALNWAQNTANASDTVVYEGSSLELWEL